MPEAMTQAMPYFSYLASPISRASVKHFGSAAHRDAASASARPIISSPPSPITSKSNSDSSSSAESLPASFVRPPERQKQWKQGESDPNMLRQTPRQAQLPWDNRTSRTYREECTRLFQRSAGVDRVCKWGGGGGGGA